MHYFTSYFNLYAKDEITRKLCVRYFRNYKKTKITSFLIFIYENEIFCIPLLGELLKTSFNYKQSCGAIWCCLYDATKGYTTIRICRRYFTDNENQAKSCVLCERDFRNIRGACKNRSLIYRYNIGTISA